MEEELEIGESYTGSELLNFLEESYRKNVLLESEENINLLSLPHINRYLVYKVQSTFLHKFILNPKSGSVGYQMNTDFRIYYIKPA